MTEWSTGTVNFLIPQENYKTSAPNVTCNLGKGEEKDFETKKWYSLIGIILEQKG